MNKSAKGKRLCSYRKEWEATNPWVKAANDAKKAFCTLCCREISISHGGENDLTRHQASNMHKKAMKAKGSSDIAASAKSSVKSKRTAFQDSCVANKTHLGRTLQKVNMITKDGMVRTRLIEPSTVELDVVSDHAVVNELTSSLRMWVPPLRLLSASIWQIIQQRQVESYNRVEEFVSVVLELVPDLLSPEERIELLLGLRTKFVLELCHDDPSVTLQMMQPHLQTVSRFSESSFSDGEMDQTVHAAVRNFVDLIQALVKSPEYRKHFFEDIYPLQYGPQYDTALQLLVWEFLSRLETLLPVPSFHQAATWFDENLLFSEDCLQMVNNLQPIQELLVHYKYFTRLLSGLPPPTMANTILATLSDTPSPLVQVVLGACEPAEICVSVPHELQSSQNESDTYGASIDEDCCEDMDGGDPQQDWQEVIIGTSQHDQQHDQTGPTLNGSSLLSMLMDSSGDVHEGISDTIQHDQQGCIQKSSPRALEKDKKGIGDFNGYCPLPGLSSSILVDANEDSSGDVYKGGLEGETDKAMSHTVDPQGHTIDPQDHTIDPQDHSHTIDPPCYRHQSIQTSLNEEEEETNSGCTNACKRTVKIKTEEDDLLHSGKGCRRSGRAKYPCSECDQTFSSLSKCENHQALHTEESILISSYCGETFTDLKEHMHAQRPNESLPQSSTLAGHQPCHTREKSVTCSFCGKSVPSLSALARHTRSHTGERPYTCEFCGKTFSDSSTLRIHTRVHTKEKPFACTMCTKRFISNTRLRRHMRTHTGEKPYVCLKCGKGFAETSNLKTHQRKHHSDSSPDDHDGDHLS